MCWRCLFNVACVCCVVVVCLCCMMCLFVVFCVVLCLFVVCCCCLFDVLFVFCVCFLCLFVFRNRRFVSIMCYVLLFWFCWHVCLVFGVVWGRFCVGLVCLVSCLVCCC